MSTNKLYLSYFPFLPEGSEIISQQEVTPHKIDTTNVFDTLIRTAANEILAAMKTTKDYHKMDMSFNIINEIEVPQFYITLMLLSKLSTVVLNHYLKYYRTKIDRHAMIVSHERDDTFVSNLYWDLIQRTNPRYVYKEDKKYFGIKLIHYMLFSSTISMRPTEYYLPLKLINMIVIGGYVLIHRNDLYRLRMLLAKVAENRILDLVKKVKEFESSKINKAVEELTNYMITQNNIDPTSGYNDIKNQIEEQKHAECVSKMLRSGIVPVKGFPPCINSVLVDIRAGEHITHAAKLLFNCYLIKKGFDKDQITDIWKYSPKFNETRTGMTLDDLFDKQITPMNCDKLEANKLCYKERDTQNRCNHIRNPLTY